jgi:hypothetical protein
MYVIVISADCTKQICAHHLGEHDCGLSASVVCLDLLNSWYTFHDMLENCHIRAVDMAHSGRYIVVKVMNPAEIVNQFMHFTRANLQTMASLIILGTMVHILRLSCNKIFSYISVTGLVLPFF